MFLLIFLCALVVTSNDCKQFKKDYKFLIITYIIKKKFSDAHYNPYKGIGRERISNTNVIYMGNQYKSSDYVYGKYKDIPFSTSDIQTLMEFKTKDNYNIQVPMFTGQWFIFDFNKTFKADVQVREKWFTFATRRTFLGNNTLYRYKLEYIRFNQKFKVYAQNELDVFNVLTQNMIGRIKNVERKVRGKIMFCFIENEIHIGLYRYVDLFENRPIYEKIDLDKEKYVLKNLRPILEFIDGLDNDLFKM